MIPGIHISDVSEFQGHPNWDAYVAGRQAGICRIGYGDSHPDIDWAFDENGVRRLPWRGFYHYLVSGQDAGVQARACIEWIENTGGLLPGDSLWLDVEEGSGDLRGVVNTYFSIVDARFGITTGLYSYGSFFNTSLGGEQAWGSRPTWIADYNFQEPTGNHALWQHTNGTNGDISCQPAPGLPHCDCSVTHLTLQQLLELPCTVRGAPVQIPTKEEEMNAIVLPNGDIKVYAAGAGDRAGHLLEFTRHDGEQSNSVIDITDQIGGPDPYTVQA
jgi:hypothetical protein